MSLVLLLRPRGTPGPPQPPSIFSFSPPSGPIGQVVVIIGQSFTGTTDVSFNGVSALTFNVDNDSQITATVPVGATSGPISVTTPIGTGTSLTNFIVTVPIVVVGQPPTIGGIEEWTIQFPILPKEKTYKFRRNMENQDRQDISDIIELLGVKHE